ncbi:MAG: hypothetical protein AAB497_00075 [Patescibacteria group bacterium]
MPDSKEPDSFEDAGKLVGYMEIHAETPRALILFKYLVWLEYVGGHNISGLNRKSLEERRFISLHQCPGVVTDARKRLDKGLVPKNWLELLNKEIDSQSTLAM